MIEINKQYTTAVRFNILFHQYEINGSHDTRIFTLASDKFSHNPIYDFLFLSDVRLTKDGYRINFPAAKQKAGTLNTFLIPVGTLECKIFHSYFSAILQEHNDSNHMCNLKRGFQPGLQPGEPLWRRGLELTKGPKSYFQPSPLGRKSMRYIPKYIADWLGYDAKTKMEFNFHSFHIKEAENDEFSNYIYEPKENENVEYPNDEANENDKVPNDVDDLGSISQDVNFIEPSKPSGDLLIENDTQTSRTEHVESEKNDYVNANINESPVSPSPSSSTSNSHPGQKRLLEIAHVDSCSSKSLEEKDFISEDFNREIASDLIESDHEDNNSVESNTFNFEELTKGLAPIVCLGKDPFELNLSPDLPKDSQRKYIRTWREFLNHTGTCLGHPPTFTQIYGFMETKFIEGKKTTTLSTYLSHICMGLYLIYNRKLHNSRQIFR